MFDKIAAVLMAIQTNEILEAGRSVGTASNQVILGCLIVALIIVVLYRERQTLKSNAALEKQHAEAITKLETQNKFYTDRIHNDRVLFDDERKMRINFLMELVKQMTGALDKSANADEAVARAVEVNTEMLRALKQAIDQGIKV